MVLRGRKEMRAWPERRFRERFHSGRIGGFGRDSADSRRSRTRGRRPHTSVCSRPSGYHAYGNAEDEAVRKVKSIALQVLADMIESGEDVPESLKALFAA